MLLSIGEKMDKKADEKYGFITIVLILVIVIIGILLHSKVYGKTDKFVSSCNGPLPFEYKCANEIENNLKDGKPSMTCPSDSDWMVNAAKECEKKDDAAPQCCYKIK